MDNRFNAEQIKKFEELLLQLMAQCKASLDNSNLETKTVSLDQSIGRVTRMDSLARQQMGIATRNRMQQQLGQATAALSRLKSGDYGQCLHCGEDIAPARLNHNPAVSFCLSCQEQTEV
jgi:DnaK suppressor protein